MKIKTRLDFIVIDGTELVVNEALKTLAKLPVSDLVEFLKGPKLYSRRDHANILKNVMRDEVWKFKLVSRVAEKGLSNDFFSRLDYFEDSPVTVLEGLFERMVKIQPELMDYYLEDLWLFAIQVVSKDKELAKLYKKAQKSSTSPVVLKELFPTLEGLFGDEEGDIDGVLARTFVEKSLHSATIKEIREIAEKNDVLLPTNITKQDIVDGIIAVLPKVAKAKDVPHLMEDVKDMTVAQLKEFVNKHKLDVPTELKKQDVGELLVKNYVNKNAANVVSDLQYELPERVEEATDFSDENPKVIRLRERVKELEKELEERPVENETKIDESELLKEQEKVEALSKELKQTKAELSEKPKEVVVEVPGPTVIRTVISKKELQKQKEHYEAIIAEQEKERSMLISRTEYDEVLAEYGRVKALLDEKDIEKLEEKPVEPKPAPQQVPQYEEPYYGSLHAKVDRLTDKVHELQLEILRKELANQKATPAPQEEQPETEVNIYFDSNLAKRMSDNKNAIDVGKAVKGKKRKKKSAGRTIFWIIFILLLLAIVVFMGAWTLEHFNITPLAGPPWLADRFNAAVLWLHNAVQSVFDIFKGLFGKVRVLGR